MNQLTNRPIGNRKDIYKQITEVVITHLESGNVVWKKGWNSLGLPKNAITNHQYRGWNAFYLNFITVIHNYKIPYFLTYRQAVEKGGYIKNGEKGYQVIYWAVIEDKVRSYFKRARP